MCGKVDLLHDSMLVYACTAALLISVYLLYFLEYLPWVLYINFSVCQDVGTIQGWEQNKVGLN